LAEVNSIRTARLALVLTAGLALGSSTVLNRFGLQDLTPLSLVALRLGLATIAFLGTLLVMRRSFPRHPRVLLDIAVVGLTTMAIPTSAFTLALQFVSSGVLSILLGFIPLFTAVMAHFWIADDRLTAGKVAGLLLALAGVVLLIATRTTGLAQTGLALDVRGQLLGLSGALVAAWSSVYARLRLSRIDVMVVTAGQTAWGFLAILPVALTAAPVNLGTVTWRGWLAAGYTGLVGSFGGFLLLFTMIQRYGPTTAALPAYVMPVVAAALGAILLGEVVTPPFVAGAIIVLVGVFLASR
jgi:drug/metabolite transporter (DMT)-like permease